MARKPKHGLSYIPEYRCWQTMRLRCNVPSNPAYKDYGARGITVCDRWIESPETFLADMGKKPTEKHELDRIDNDKGYSPENCRWATRSENDRNRRSNRFLEYDGHCRTIAEWAERHNIRSDTLTYRLDNGWDIALALSTPTREKSSKGHAKPLKHPCLGCGVLSSGARCHSCENKSRPTRVAASKSVPPPVACDVIEEMRRAA
jgi:hypothetical protein